MDSLSSSCSEPVFDEFGRASIAVDQPGGGGDNYPFVGASDIDKLIADLYLIFRDDSRTIEKPLRIAWLYGFGCTSVAVPITPEHVYDLLIVDANDVTVFDSREADAPDVRDWGTRLKIATFVKDDSVLRVVWHVSWNQDEEPVDYDLYIAPTNGILDERVSETVLPRVRSLRVDLGSHLSEHVRLANGYNTVLTVEPLELVDGGRVQTEISIDVEAGSGKGRFGPACDDDDGQPIVRRVNNQQADVSGNFTFDAAECLRLERPVLEVLSEDPPQVSVRANALKLFNDCGVCCECQDFINTYEGIRRLRNRYADLYLRALAARDTYLSNLTRVQNSFDCRIEDNLRVVLRPVCPDELLIAVGFCHTGSDCLTNLIIPISFQYVDAPGEGFTAATSTVSTTPEIICNSSFRAGNAEQNPQRGVSSKSHEPYRLGGKWPYYYAVWERVDPGTLATVTWRVGFPGSGPADLVEVVVDAYSLPELAVTELSGPSSSIIPIEGYGTGSGPGEAALPYRVVTRPKKVSTGLLQDECCPAESLSEVE